MSQSRAKIVRRLEKAQRDRTPVTVGRKDLEFDRTSGFVVAVLHDWVVLQDLADAVHLDDVVLLRLDGVTKVKRHQDAKYVARAVAELGEALAEFDCPADATTADLLRAISTRADLVAIILETPDDFWFNIGRIQRVGNKRLDLHYIARDGVWADFVDAWKLEDITRIEFGGRYIRALERFGESRPADQPRVKR